MIKTNELRIGNLLFDVIEKKEWSITLDDFAYMRNYLGSDHPIPFAGIPITPEILEKCGFEKPTLDTCAALGLDFGKSYITPFARKRLALAFDDNGLGQINSYWVEDIGMAEVLLTYDIKYLHQVQNLYFALTGEELPIKELTDAVTVS